ncbi:MAG: pirin family protein [Candidatus Uhrbacteria bacterium]|nr:pirin family protein [Candidatus Uhrbacteria bacterium]
MSTRFYPNNERGTSDIGWLSSKFSFSFADFYDPDLEEFGTLRVLNDDTITPNAGFPPHSHRDMEIITIPIRGALKHEDSMGHSEVVSAGEVQVMSAGSGVMHSEFNASATEPVSLFQIWIQTAVRGVTPRYDQKRFDWQSAPHNQLQLIVSNDARDESLMIHQNAFFSIGIYDAAQKGTYKLQNASNGIYLFVIDGRIHVGDQELTSRDALGVTDASQIDFETIALDTQILLIEVPMT